ncbi:MAG: SH3 domain-containing protein [Rhodospirillales bacterium]|nr:SH3 domain-containing protein [Rhodospirillales bacterium]
MRTLATLAAVFAAAAIWIADANAAEDYTVDPLDRVMTVAKPANVRAGPGLDYDVQVALNAGVTVRVTGAVQGRDWLRVDLRGDGGEAFIYAPLVKDVARAPFEPFGPDWSVAENQPCQVWNWGMGHKYESFTWSGACENGKATGIGRLIWVSRFGKNVYEGGMRAGKQHGTGKLRSSDGARYEGQWRDGHRHGRGIYKWAIGHRYEGGWSDDRPHGFGTATFADGDVHKGQWRMGCYGERDGIWSALIATVEDCGFN